MSPILQQFDIAEELLRDPAGWLEAPKMEALLKEIDRHFRDLPEDFVSDIGRNSEQLRCWGVLDSVLKMVESPLEIYRQPSRFISYFISPEPPIAGWKRDDSRITFQLPVSSQQYPFITQYISGALEGLPNYMGQSTAQVDWDDCNMQILWSQTQENLLPKEDLEVRQFNSQWVRSMMDSLEQHQKNLENKNAEGIPVAPPAGLHEMQMFLSESGNKFEKVFSDIMSTKNDFLKLHDYFVRSQQLITFLISSGRKTKQVDEAMRRMDWQHVQSAYADMVEKACERILDSKDTVKSLLEDIENYKASTAQPDAPGEQDLQLPMQ